MLVDRRVNVSSGTCEEIDFPFFAGNSKCIAECQNLPVGHLIAKFLEAQISLLRKIDFFTCSCAPVPTSIAYSVGKPSRRRVYWNSSPKSSVTMPYSKSMVCLANSRKLNARCVAGREWDGKRFGAWIRPVSSAEKGELGPERYCEPHRDPLLLDVIEVPFLEPRPSGYQSENHLVDARSRWRYCGTIAVNQILPAIENINGPLWVNGGSTGNGQNDRITRAAAMDLPNSLVLVQPRRLTMTIHTEGVGFPNPRRRVRGRFSLNDAEYVLAVTDPVVEGEFRAKADGSSREVERPILCVSLSEIFETRNECYKLIAGIIET